MEQARRSAKARESNARREPTQSLPQVGEPPAKVEAGAPRIERQPHGAVHAANLLVVGLGLSGRGARTAAWGPIPTAP